MKLTGGWRVERENPNGLLLEMFRFARGDEALSAKTYPILTIQAILLGENYTGPVTLETSFRTAVRISSPHLSTECPEEQENRYIPLHLGVVECESASEKHFAGHIHRSHMPTRPRHRHCLFSQTRTTDAGWQMQYRCCRHC